MRLALVGDIHGQWSQADVAWFDASDYDAVLLTGDLPGNRLHRDDVAMAARVGALSKRSVLIPGNHDGPTAIDVLREALAGGITGRGGQRMARKMAAIEEALGAVEVGGWSVHDLGAIEVVVARPHAMDNRKLTFAPYLAARFGVETLEQSAERLVATMRQTAKPYVVLAHNGPAGFGSGARDPWGLSLFGRDNGDPDLAEALGTMRAEGRPPLAVVTGHMHWNRLRPRDWSVERHGIRYVNAARCPRVSRGVRRHVALEIDVDRGRVRAELVEVPET